MIKAFALICLSAMSPQDCTRDNAEAVVALSSRDPITVTDCAMSSLTMLASTRLPGKARYVKIVCEEARQ